jgi:hypothetical protein
MLSQIEGGEPINILVKTDNDTEKRLRTLIDKVRRSPGVPSLTSEEYRSLKDLIAYAGDAKFGADGMGILISTNSKALVNGTNIKKYINLAEEGLNKLQQKGLARTEVAKVINQKMFTGGYKLNNANFKFLTYNGLNYDIPALKEVFGNASFIKNASGHIDLMETFKQAYGDVWGKFYKGRLGPDETVQGALRLENVFKSVFGMSMEQAGYKAHVGVSDVMAMADVTGSQLPDILSIINAGRKTGGHNLVGSYGGLATSMQYQDSTLKNGIRLFARGSSYRGSELDSVIDTNSQEAVRKYGRGTYKNRLYTLEDQWEKEYNGQKYFGVTLHNVDDDLYHTIARTNREDLQAVIQKDFVPYSSKMPGYAEVSKYRRYDAARREYESLFMGPDSARKAQKYMNAISAMEATLPRDAEGNARKLYQL